MVQSNLQTSGDFPIALFNGTVATTNGIYKISDISIEEAKKMIQRYSFVSAIGHEAAAEVMSDILQIEIPMNRIQFQQKVGQRAVVLKLNTRPAEGSILNKDEMLDIGYTLKLMERLE
ncbi:MAG: YddF family protein [Clostridiaceae bacterium]|nr:YddF family protein [Clostridiaceae bacterium]